MSNSRIARIVANQKRYVVKDFLMSVALSAGLLASAAALL